MKRYRVIKVDFDFETEDGVIDEESQERIKEFTLSKTWEASSHDDLAEEISNKTGWCVFGLLAVEEKNK